MAKLIQISLIVMVLLQVSVSMALPVYQFLPARPGYVPVYIRIGDEPLENINPSLAEAFGEHPISARNIKEDTSGESPVKPVVDLPALPPPKPSTK